VVGREAESRSGGSRAVIDPIKEFKPFTFSQHYYICVRGLLEETTFSRRCVHKYQQHMLTSHSFITDGPAHIFATIRASMPIM
jgi:hypothetical protein